ncbi:ribosomal RNA-processing protein 7 homolog A [Topomyia yanbarensis]|uniref:ribosomal RNA-processing protein 7 homolog A n=1 Tax=Topomyia yanbarensis TaxID=2498891 RepID=UPI00273C292D|nr:ribosomal RNA-processing protein 7 homolog A [Topomyia yanbarensis]
MCVNAVDDFTDIPLKYDSQDTAFHYVLVRENVSKASNKLKPAGRTLFVLNVPPYATSESLKTAFSSTGAVSSIIVQEKPSEECDTITEPISRFKVCYVVYEQSSSLRKLLKSRKLNALNADGKLLTGIDKWTKEYQERIPDPVELQREINEYMAGYDRNMSEQKAQQETVPDDEGWVTVSKANANTFSQREATVNKLEEKISKGRKQKELKNFYTFQIREAKKDDIVSLRKKYDRDLKKMQQVKKTKRFKPY